jgi:membrane fusion protein (multidrug efflux system)
MSPVATFWVAICDYIPPSCERFQVVESGTAIACAAAVLTRSNPHWLRLVWSLGILLGITACRAAPTTKVELDEYPVGAPSVGATFSREYVGQVLAARMVEFRARQKGVIEQVGVDEGQSVKEGQLLFAIGARELQQSLAKAQASVESATAEWKAAQIEVNNSRLLVENKVISSAELEAAEARLAALAAKIREAKAEVGEIEVKLSFARVQAPFAGTVNRIPRKVGALVLEDELLTTLTDTSEVLVYFRVSEQEYLDHAALARKERTATKELVSLILANGTPYSHPGEVDTVESEFDRETGNISFRARFPNPEGLLKHGATGKVVLRREEASALVVPISATFELQENVYVYTVDPEGTVHANRILPRLRTAQGLVVESGLTASDRIVLEGAARLKDGLRIVARAPEPRLEGRTATP